MFKGYELYIRVSVRVMLGFKLDIIISAKNCWWFKTCRLMWRSNIFLSDPHLSTLKKVICQKKKDFIICVRQILIILIKKSTNRSSVRNCEKLAVNPKVYTNKFKLSSTTILSSKITSRLYPNLKAFNYFFKKA